MGEKLLANIKYNALTCVLQQIGLNVIEDKTKGHDHQSRTPRRTMAPIIVPEQLYFLWGEGQDAIVGPAFQGVFPVFADEFKAASA